MANVNDGGQAFPVLALSPSGDEHYVEGMSLRDWFAGQAVGAALNAAMTHKMDQRAWPVTITEVAEKAYRVADAMLKAREA